MSEWIADRYQQERINDIIRAIEQQRLVTAALAARPRLSLRSSLLAWLGDWMIAWGHRLRARYGRLGQVPLGMKTGEKV
jgi:hypothetical protein